MSRTKARTIMKRMTLDLDEIDLANIEDIKECRGLFTMSEAMRNSLNVNGRICRREILERGIETEALKRVREQRVEYG